MADFLIFERSVSRNDPNTDIFIKMVCDSPNEVNRITPQSLEVIEGMGMSSPLVIFTFMDATGDLFNHQKLDTDATFTLSFGRTVDNSVDILLKVAKYEQMNGVLGRPHDISTKVTFMVDNWFEMIGKKHNKGWAKTKLSDIINEIAGEMGYEEVTVTQSEEERPSTIQPYWSNFKMFNWIKSKIKPKEGDGDSHFEFGVTVDKNFFFQSTNDIIKQKESDISSGNISVFRMEAPPKTAQRSQEKKNENNQQPAYFLGFHNKEFSTSGLVGGASGFESMYFDWDKGELVTETHTFDKEDVSQLSDYSSIREAYKESGTKYFGGRDVNTPYEAKNILNESSYSMQDFSITTEGTPSIRIFDIIEVVIPNTSLGSKVPINSIYSGFYLVSMVKNRFNFGKIIDYVTEIGLSRHGVDNTDYDNFDDLVVSSKGKI